MRILGPLGIAAELVQGIRRLIHPRQERQSVFVEKETRLVEIEPGLMPGFDGQEPSGAEFTGIIDRLTIDPSGIRRAGNHIAFRVIFAHAQLIDGNYAIDVHQ